MFHPIPSTPDFKSLEEATLKLWKDRQSFEKSVLQRQGGLPYVFYEEPAGAHAKPNVPQMLGRAIADVFPRYQAMRGRHVLRRGGWNTHGLPVELSVESKLGLATKKEIEAFGVAAFNAKCRQAAFDYIHEWEQLNDRIGFWFDPKEAYVTFADDYVESVWWILRQLWDRDLLVQSYDVVAYCPRCGTPLSEREVMCGAPVHLPEGERLVRFPLVEEADTSLLAWTTDAWTLPANAALAVQPDAAYVKIRRAAGEGGDVEHLILAREAVDRVMGPEAFEIVETFTGGSLRGRRYRPLFTFLLPDRPAHRVVPASFVNLAVGSGVEPLAPAFNAAALRLAEDYDLPVLMPLDAEGRFVEEVTPWRGKLFIEADPLITYDLADRGLLFRSAPLLQAPEVCGHCQAPIIHYARNAWTLKTTHLRERLKVLGQGLHSHLTAKQPESGTLSASDTGWVLGRERYWGTPLPIWVCDACGHVHCVGSAQELSELARQDRTVLNLHRPSVDELSFACPKCREGHMRRVPDVVDAWFDVGAMPAAEWHYPFENRDRFEEHFPAAACQAATAEPGWTESVQAVSGLIFDRAAAEHLIGLGPVFDSAGRPWPADPAHSRDPWDVLDAHGADALRWFLCTSAAAQAGSRISADLLGQAARACQVPLWKCCAFFVAHANLARWTPGASPEASAPVLDRWILSELHRLVRDVTAAYDGYDLPGATRPVEQFVADLAGWYLPQARGRMLDARRSAPAGRQAAFSTLYECLTTLVRLIAPAMPFVAEALYQALASSLGTPDPDSVHLSDWPAADPERIDEALAADMRLARKLAALGHEARQKASRRISQPLAEAAFLVQGADEQRALATCADVIAGDLNVKTVRALGSSEEAAVHVLNPRLPALEAQYGARAAAIRAALLKVDAEQAAQALLAGTPVAVTADGQEVAVQPDDVEVRLTAREGFAVAGDGAHLAALRTGLTPDLVREGLACEFIHRVQALREAAGLDLADLSLTYYSATPLLAKAIAAYVERIRAETLSAELIAGAAPEDAAVSDEAFEGEKVRVGIIRK